MTACRTCDKVAYVSIGWQQALAGTYHDPAAIARNLQLRQRLKFGQLYQCLSCDLYWFLDDNGVNMHRVTRDKNAALFEWSDLDLEPTDSQIDCFRRIGATGPDQYGNRSDRITIPCEVETISGDRWERALILITKMPPIAGHRRSLLGNAVTTIRPSDFALPLNVRLATLNADEIRMMFAPTRVQASDGRYFILNWSPNFFEYGPLKGADISISPAVFLETGDVPVVGEDVEKITYVYYDWFVGCESLIENAA